MNERDVESKVLHELGRAMGAFSMLERGDRIAVGVSGGKDSLCLLDALVRYRRRAPFPYELVAITIEQGKFKVPIGQLEEQMRRTGVEWVLRPESSTLGLVADGVEHGCDVCSRHRRRALYQAASDRGCTVLALGHTADDCAESLLRNILFNGRIASLPPVAMSGKGPIRLIRPLVFVSEELTAAYVLEKELLTVDCVCAEKGGPRSEIREFLESMSSRHIDVPESVRAALANVNPYSLFDPKLHKEGADRSLIFQGKGESKVRGKSEVRRPRSEVRETASRHTTAPA